MVLQRVGSGWGMAFVYCGVFVSFYDAFHFHIDYKAYALVCSISLSVVIIIK